MKYFLGIMVVLSAISVTSLAAASVKADRGALGDILRDSIGNIRELNQAEAVAACAELGQRLPDIFELAWESQASNRAAMGVSQAIPNGANPSDYMQIRWRPSDQARTNSFYFNKNGYSRGDKNFEQNTFWSSSLNESNNYMGFVLSGWDGSIQFGFAVEHNYAVRCVR